MSGTPSSRIRNLRDRTPRAKTTEDQTPGRQTRGKRGLFESTKTEEKRGHPVKTETPLKSSRLGSEKRTRIEKKETPKKTYAGRTLRLRTPVKQDERTLPKKEKDEESESVSEEESYSTESDAESESDSDWSTKKKQKRSAATPRKSDSAKASSSRRSRRRIKGSIPERLAPCDEPATPVSRAERALSVGNAPESLPCRESEFEQIYSFVKGKVADRNGGCMYVSGVPGTGKTATLERVVRKLQTDRTEFTYVYLNGLQLTDPHQAYVRLLSELKGEKATPTQAAQILNEFFGRRNAGSKPIVLAVDELDLLNTKRQGVLYNLFDWPTRRKSGLVIVAIANTMDLPERCFTGRVTSRLGLTRLTFEPYTFQQLVAILNQRVDSEGSFQKDAVTFVARKVASFTGDARRALQIARRAAAIADAKGTNPVDMMCVQDAIEEMFSSPIIKAIGQASELEKLFLRAVISEFRRTGLDECTLAQASREFAELCSFDKNIKFVPNSYETASVCMNLGSSRILITEAGWFDSQLRIQLNANIDEILYALGESK